MSEGVQRGDEENAPMALCDEEADPRDREYIHDGRGPEVKVIERERRREEYGDEKIGDEKEREEFFQDEGEGGQKCGVAQDDRILRCEDRVFREIGERERDEVQEEVLVGKAGLERRVVCPPKRKVEAGLLDETGDGDVVIVVCLVKDGREELQEDRRDHEHPENQEGHRARQRPHRM